jgi:hypothetical protein
MGRCQRGVHFGAVDLEKVEESSKFFPYFFLTLFLNNPVILWQLQIIFELISDFSYNFLRNLFAGPQTKTQAGGIFYSHYLFTRTSTLTPSH